MSFWTKIMSIGALGVTLLSSGPAWAVSPHSGPYGVCRSNSAVRKPLSYSSDRDLG
jgi:hypothetical protein